MTKTSCSRCQMRDIYQIFKEKMEKDRLAAEANKKEETKIVEKPSKKKKIVKEEPAEIKEEPIETKEESIEVKEESVEMIPAFEDENKIED